VSARTSSALKLAAEIAVPVALLVGWQVWTVHAQSQYFPRLSTILVEFRDMWLFSQFGTHVVPSLERIVLGFGIAVVVGIALGIPLGLSRWGRLAAMPHIEFWRAIPPPALLPISVVLLHSIGNVQKVSFIAFFCVFPVVLPAAMPQIAAGMRVRLALAVIIMVVAEYFSSTSGVGYVLLISKNTFQMGPMWAAIVLIGLLGYLLSLLFGLAERYFLAWHRGWRAAIPG
jgi:sulfonate transport system permease protein